jgi:hypothetical protein
VAEAYTAPRRGGWLLACCCGCRVACSGTVPAASVVGMALLLFTAADAKMMRDMGLHVRGVGLPSKMPPSPPMRPDCWW